MVLELMDYLLTEQLRKERVLAAIYIIRNKVIFGPME